MKKTAQWLSLTIGLLASTSVLAQQNTPSQYYIAPYGSYLHPGGDTAGFDGWGSGLGIGRMINPDFNLEVRGFWQNYANRFSCCGNGQTDIIGASLDLAYYIMRDTWSPYVVGSLGGLINDTQASHFSIHESAFLFEAGVGSAYQVTEQFALRADVRYRLNTLPVSLGSDNVLNDLTVNVGFVIPLTP